MMTRFRRFLDRHAILVWAGVFGALLGFGAILPVAAQQPTRDLTVLTSASRTATTVNSADQQNGGWRGVVIALDVSSALSGTYTLQIQGKDPVSSNYYNMLPDSATAPVSGVSTNTYVVYPGLPRVWRIQLIGASTPTMTLSVGGSLLQ